MKSEDRMIYLLSTARQALIDHTNKSLLKAGIKTTLAQAGVLFLLIQRDMRNMSEFGQIFGIDKSAVTYLIDKLEKNGLVERNVQEGNRRAFLIHITSTGIKEAKKAREIVNGINQEIKTSFDSREIEAYKKVLSGIIEKFRPPK